MMRIGIVVVYYSISASLSLSTVSYVTLQCIFVRWVVCLSVAEYENGRQGGEGSGGGP